MKKVIINALIDSTSSLMSAITVLGIIYYMFA